MTDRSQTTGYPTFEDYLASHAGGSVMLADLLRVKANDLFRAAHPWISLNLAYQAPAYWQAYLLQAKRELQNGR